MKSFNIYIFILLCTAVAWGCSDSAPGPGPDGPEAGDRQELLLGAGFAGMADAALSRAGEAFPNDGRIGVVATYYNSGSPDWREYPDIDNEPATAGMPDVSDVYTFAWDVKKYWPMDNSQLVFLAYSPFDGESSAVSLGYNRTDLGITLLQTGMPDVMYASANGALKPYSKMSTPVDLGEFRHALSRLTVEVVPDTPVNTDIKLSSLSITTTKTSATLDLLSGTMTPGADGSLTYNIVTSPVDFITPGGFGGTVYMYPGTEQDFTINVTLNDSTYDFSATFDIDDFDEEQNSGPLVLERAKNLVLRIKVNSASVQNPNDEIDLKGVLKEWNYVGNFGITIN